MDAVVTDGHTPDELAEAAAVLRAVLDQVDAGELTMSGPSRRRLEGAVVTLEALASSSGEPSP
jgi:hypothetical protein